MQVKTIATSPYPDQRPGTSGLRKKTQQFLNSPNYLENYIQSCFDAIAVDKNQPIIIGGDGRFYNEKAIQQTIRIALANDFTDIRVCQNGLLSTPACSHLIRHYGASLGFVFSASHNPGGANGDVGIKLNLANGGPAPELVTNRIYEHSQQITQYFIADTHDLDLSACQYFRFNEARVAVIDGIEDYVALMQSLFDFDKLRHYLTTHRFQYDAMHAVTGPYAKRLFVDKLGVNEADLLNHTPQSDFSGIHPDPSPSHAKALFQNAMQANCPFSLLAASDGDGDRNMILAPNCFVSPGDSLAVIAANHKRIKQFQNQPLKGVARSLPTSRAIDAVAQQLALDCYVTPTGWKYFGQLLDHERIGLCGEESFGTSGHHIREKDGIWAVLCWLSILADSGQSVHEILTEHWQQFGRHYYARYDYESLDAKVAEDLLATLRMTTTDCLLFNGHRCTQSGDFSYQDPITNEITSNQGVAFTFGNHARFVVRLSGTGTDGATLRLYLEVFDQDYQKDPLTMVKPLADLAINCMTSNNDYHLGQPTYII